MTYAVQKLEELLRVKAFEIRGRRAVFAPVGEFALPPRCSDRFRYKAGPSAWSGCISYFRIMMPPDRACCGWRRSFARRYGKPADDGHMPENRASHAVVVVADAAPV